MKPWQLAAVAVLVPGGAIVWLATWLRRRRQQQAFWSGPNYVKQIAILAPERPMTLPTVRDIRSTVRRARPFWRRQRA
jgi:hypothetical protein